MAVWLTSTLALHSAHATKSTKMMLTTTMLTVQVRGRARSPLVRQFATHATTATLHNRVDYERGDTKTRDDVTSVGKRSSGWRFVAVVVAFSGAITRRTSTSRRTDEQTSQRDRSIDRSSTTHAVAHRTQAAASALARGNGATVGGDVTTRTCA